MKPLHILALVLAGAAGGALIMKVAQRPQPVTAVNEVAASPIQEVSAPAATPAQPPPAVTPTPAVKEVPVQPEPVEAKPSAPPQRVAAKKPSPMPPPPAHPRPLIMAQVQRPAPTTPVQEPPPATPSAPQPAEVQLNAGAPAPAPQVSPIPAAPPAVPQPENVTPPAPQPEVHTVTLNAGMLIPVRLLDGLSTERNSQGDPFVATLDRELVADGWVIAERGARVEGRVVAADKGTKMRAGATLTVELIRLHTSDGQIVPIETDAFEKRISANRTTDAEKVGAGVAIGAIIGALAGGGKGAAVGAGAGGGAGAGSVLLTRQPAALPSETRINFRLRAAVRLTEKAAD
jgi:hypothetical protein